MRGGIDMTGERHGLLTIIKRAGCHTDGSATWHCACECGGSVITTRKALISGDRVSCGCLRTTRDPRILLAAQKRQRPRKPAYRSLDEVWAEVKRNVRPAPVRWPEEAESAVQALQEAWP